MRVLSLKTPPCALGCAAAVGQKEYEGPLGADFDLHDETGKRRSKWIATHLPVRGNKRRAEEMLLQARQQHTDLYHRTGPASLLFSDYMLQWLAGMEENAK